MDILKRTNDFIELLEMDPATLKDMYTKYATLANAYAGSTDKEVIKSNKKTYEILLATNMVDYMLYMYMGGSLTGVIASNPNLSKLLDKDSPIYINKIIKSLSDSNWEIRKQVSTTDIKEALLYWGVKEADDISGADIIDQSIDTDGTPVVSFDDEGLEEFMGFGDTEVESGTEGDGHNFDTYAKDMPVENTDEDDGINWGEALGEESGDTSGDESGNVEGASEDKSENVEDAGSDSSEVTEEDLERIASQMAIEEAANKVGHTSDIKDFNPENEDEIRARIEARDSAIERELAERQAAMDKKAVTEAVDKATKENTTVDPVIVKKTVSQIMAIYDIVYKPLFTATPSGMLTSAGIATVKKDHSLHLRAEGQKYAIKFMQSIKSRFGKVLKELDYHEEISIDCINPDGTLKYNYIPNWHIRNIYGVYRGKDGTLKQERNWAKFRGHLVSMLTECVTKLFSAFKGDDLTLSMSLVELFTTVFIMEEFDIEKTMKMSIKSISIGNISKGYESIGKMVAEGQAFPIDISGVELINNSVESNGVHNILVVFDKKAYNSEIMFAYKPIRKILESGGKLGLKQTLLGRDLKGRDVTYNFESPQAVVSLIIAGSGSGKGVVTLNILATFIAEGCPTVYVDWKPDMAAMLWDLERATGAKILSIDGLAGRTETSSPVRDYGIGRNMPNIPSVSDKLNVIPYVKAFQIMVLCAQARNIGYNGMSSKGKKMQFIFDEAQAMNKTLSDLRSACNAFLEDKENKPSKNNPPSEQYLYVKKVKKFLDSMFAGSTTFRNTTGRTGNVGMIMLGQQADCSAWANGAIKRDPIGFLVGNCSMKMLGKDATDNGKYSMNGCSPDGASFLGNMGYFALIPQAVADKSAPEKVKVVKSYLVLNENDYNPDNPGRFTSGILKNIEDPIIQQSIIDNDFYNTDEAGNTYLNRQVGFQGLVEYIGSTISGFNLKTNLESGYVEVEKLLTGLGIIGPGGYSNIEQYLFDCSSNGIFTLDELSTLVKEGGTILDLIEDDLGDMGDEEEEPSGFNSIGDDPFHMSSGEGTLHEDTSEGHTGNIGADTFNFGDNSGTRGTEGTKLTSPLTRDAQEIIRRKQEYEAQQHQVEQGVPVQPTQPQRVQFNPAYQSESGRVGQSEIEDDIVEVPQQQPQRFGSNWDSYDVEDDGRGHLHVVAKPLDIPSTEEAIFNRAGKNGRVLYVTPGPTTHALGLTTENSVVVEMPTYGTEEKYNSRLFKTLWGTQYEFKNRWKMILDTVASSMNANVITRLILTEDAIVFNKKQVATLNLLGGDEDIRIEDIVDFKMTAKKFKNISSLTLDEIIFEKAQIEFKDAIGGLFRTFPSLQQLTILAVGCGGAKDSISRRDYEAGRMSAKMQERENRARMKSQMEVVVAAKNPNLRTKSPGYQNRVWEASKNFQSQGWGAARDAITAKNPKLFKAAGISLVTLGVLGVGAVFGAVGKVGSMLRRR